MGLRLTDFQLAALTGAHGGTSPSELAERAVEFDARRPPEPRWASPRPARRRASARRTDTLLETVLPAATGRALTIATGQILRIEQLDDGQCVDLTAFELAEPRRAFSAARTRAEYGIHPTTGTTLLSAPPETPLLTIVGDSAPGHDLSFPACTPFEYERPTGIDGHLSCHGIHESTQRRLGLDASVPEPLNLWLRSAIDASGELHSWPAACRRGDSIELRADTSATVVLSACPDDLYGSSQFEPKPVRLIVRAGDGPRIRPRITQARRTPPSAIARHTVEIELGPDAREHVERVRAGGWLGFSPEEVTRALLCRFLEQQPPGAARSPRTASSARPARRRTDATPADER